MLTTNSRTLHGLFFEQLSRTPDAIAAIGEGQTASFADLANLALRVATALQDYSCRSEALVGICLGRSLKLLACALGTVLSGCAYLPLNPRDPTGRLQDILESAEISCLVTDEAGAAVGTLLCPTLRFDELPGSEALQTHGGRIANDAATPDCLAYVIYTSGSTGAPKGVEITHHSVVNTIEAVNALCGLEASDRIFNVSPPGFDLSVYDFFGAWAAGAAVVLAGDTTYPQPRDWIRSMTLNRVTVWNSAPALLEILLDAVEHGGETVARCFDALRVVMLSGDRISPHLVRRITRLRPGVRVLAMGGATEASIWSVHNWVQELPAASAFVPYGVALPNQSTAVLDSNLTEVPVGQVGDLHIGGRGLARGYRARPDLTAGVFIADPWRPGERLYATGDRVRRGADGNMEFVGRKDGQVKIRGFRVEVAEVERALLQMEEVERAAVVCQASSHGNSLLAYVVLRRSVRRISVADLHRGLSEWLPSYMIPEELRFLDELPLTQNGKIDLVRLRDCDTRAAPPLGTRAGPGPNGSTSSDIEKTVAAIWCEVLSLDDISREQHYLDLGGNSLLASRIATRLSEALAMHLDVRDIFENPTIAWLSATLDEQLTAMTGGLGGEDGARTGTC